MTDINQFIPQYPRVDDPELASKLAHRKEFYELRLSRDEAVPEQSGDLLLIQRLVSRIISSNTPYRSALFHYAPGTGKTCTGAAVVEAFKHNEFREPALVFVTGEDLMRTYQREISRVCTNNVYLPRATRKELEEGIMLSEMAKVRRLNRAIAQSYEIVTYETFLKNLPLDEAIKRDYSNRVIIIDESHTIRKQPKTRIEDDGDDDDEGGKKGKKPKMHLYDRLHHFLHTVENCVILNFTGTPIWDQTHEIAAQMNLILPLDEQLPTGRDFDKQFFDKDQLTNDEDLRRAFRGRVSFLRPLTTTAKRIEYGVVEPLTQHVRVYPDVMSEFQAIAVQRARDEITRKEQMVKGKLVVRETKGGVVWKKARGAANLVIPVFNANGEIEDVAYGQEAFEKYFTKKVTKRDKKGDTVTTKIYDINNKFLREAYKNDLATYSAKFASIIKWIKDYPKELAFIPIEAVTGEGAIVLSLILQLHGFYWAKDARDIATTSSSRRFVTITSDPFTTNESKKILDLLESINRPDNRYADRLQVVIGSDKIILGQTLKHFRQYHGAMPDWNIPSLDQANARIFRFGSHQSFPENERYVRIFRHVAVEAGSEKAPGKDQVFPFGSKFSSEQTIDLYIYEIAENKEYKNVQIYRVEKEEAFDCPLTYERNVVPEDIDGTRDCDYQECNYTCSGMEPTSTDDRVWSYAIDGDQLDTLTYDLFYGDQEIAALIERIKDSFKIYFALHIDLLASILGLVSSQNMLFLAALNTIIDKRIQVINRYGFKCYVKEENNIIFLDDSVSATSSYAESIYTSEPLVSERNTLGSLIDMMELSEDKPKTKDFCKAPTQEKFEAMSYKTQIVLLEAMVAFEATVKLNASQQEVYDILMSEYDDRLYTMSDGYLVHVLYTEEFTGASYDVAAKEITVSGKMRIFDPKHGWSTLIDLDQEQVYVEEIKIHLAETKNIGFENNPYGLYGWISKKDKSFRLVVQEGKKGKARGRKCINFHHISALLDIVVNKLKYYPKSNPEYDDFKRKELIRTIRARPGLEKFKENIKELSDKQLRSLLTLMASSVSELCEMIQKWLAKHNLLYML